MNTVRFAFALISAASFLVDRGYAEGPKPADDPSGLGRIAAAFEVELVTVNPVFPVKTKHGTINGTAVSQTELKEYGMLFATEFSLYPASMVKRSQLQRIVFCKRLSFTGQLRNAIPDFENHTLYLDVSRGKYSKTYLSKVIHHELFHVFDLRDDGKLYGDDDWAALNPHGFKYGRGGRNVQDLAHTSVLTDRFPGFLNHYSTTAVEEDKAEVFANLIVESKYVEERLAKDPVLRAKVDRMKRLLVTFCPDMNAEFWNTVTKVTRAGE